MKILFYDTDDFEFDYFLENTFNLIEPYFFKISLQKSTYIDEKYSDCEAISAFVNSDLSKEVLSKFKNLKFIFLRCTGFSNVDLKYAKSKNIKVYNVPNYSTTSVAEFAFALILNISRNISFAKENLKKGNIDIALLTGHEISNKTIGIVGLGSIGKKISHFAKSFDMNVLAYDIKQDAEYSCVDLDYLVKNSDYICISCPLTEQTRHLINRDKISKMKNSAFIINIARGEIIETEALYNAIVNKKIKGAALDVVECEQTLCKVFDECNNKDIIKSNCFKKYLFISKLMQSDNVLITPHIAYNTFEAKKRTVEVTIQNIKSCFDINSGTKNLVLI